MPLKAWKSRGALPKASVWLSDGRVVMAGVDGGAAYQRATADLGAGDRAVLDNYPETVREIERQVQLASSRDLSGIKSSSAVRTCWPLATSRRRSAIRNSITSRERGSEAASMRWTGF